jgi:hypothetical protein
MNRNSRWIIKKFKSKRLIDYEETRVPVFQLFGYTLILIGVLYLVYKIVFPIKLGNSPINGDKMAMTFFIIMLGISFAFPSMLKDQNKGLSTMRIAVFMIINVFVILCIKIGWNCGSLKEFVIDKTWGYIIGAALGSKAIQSLGENNILGKSADPVNDSKENTGPHSSNTDSSNTNNEVPLHDPKTINRPPSVTPPNHIKK